jgi:hypothetical protein
MRMTMSTLTPRRSARRPVLLASLAAGSLLLLTACGGGSATPSAHGAGHGSSADPMPSATQMGDMGGMGTHHADFGKGLLATEDGYTLKPSSSALTVGKQTISFQILDKDGMPQTAYVEDQTKMLHFYLVRLDLTGYQHLHPTLKDGTWSIEVNAAAPGPYRMYTDFIAKDSGGADHPLVLSTVLTAPGTYTPVALPPATGSATADGLTATLTGTITAGTESKVSFQVTEGGKPVSDLEQYLDSFAHLTALHAGDAAYQHVHPELTASPGQKGGPALPFAVDLPEKGTWRLFLQVQRAGTLHLLPLTVTVS